MANYLEYSRWKADYQGILEGLSSKNIFMTYSGGKDSTLILHFLQKAAQEFGFNFETHAVSFPAHVFTSEEIGRLTHYWKERGIEIKWHKSNVMDERLNEALSQGTSPCLVCNQAKKEILLNFFKSTDLPLDSIVIIMNYSLWDLVSATIEHILGAIYKDGEKSIGLKGKNTKERFFETSQRFYPSLTVNDGLSIFKPLIKYNDQEILEAISRYDLPLTETACEFKDYRPKRLFANYYHQMDLQFDYDKVLNFSKEALQLPDITYFENTGMQKYLSTMV